MSISASKYDCGYNTSVHAQPAEAMQHAASIITKIRKAAHSGSFTVAHHRPKPTARTDFCLSDLRGLLLHVFTRTDSRPWYGPIISGKESTSIKIGIQTRHLDHFRFFPCCRFRDLFGRMYTSHRRDESCAVGHRRNALFTATHLAYIEQIFDPGLVALGYYTDENAESWLNIDEFMRWLGHQAQKAPAAPPNHRATHPRASSQLLPPSSPIPGTSSPCPQHPRTSKPSARPQTSSPTAVLDSDYDDIPAAPLLPPRRNKRGKPDSKEDSDSDSVLVITKRKGKRRKQDGGTEMQDITKQLRVRDIRDITTLQSSWTIPRTDDGESFAYRLDFTGDSREWLDSKKEPLSMAAIIKSEDQDSWGGGSAGSIKKATKVIALDDVLCQVAFHTCQGVFVCCQLDVSLLDGHERYEPDDDEMRELFEAEREVNVRETSSVAIRAAAFYQEIHVQCPHIDGVTGVQCTGLPVYRQLKEINLDGKHGFIGCQNYRMGETRSHRFRTIHRDVKEEYLRELLPNDGKYQSDPGLDPQSAVCARVLPPRSGGKGDRLCRSTRHDYSPRMHCNHPKLPSRKVSRQGKDAYVEAIAAAGVSGLTVLKCDFGSYPPSTSRIFGGQIPAVLDPALANPRIKRKLIQDIKKIHSPCGLGIEGVLAWQKQMQSLPHGKQYVWKVTSENGEEIVITMLPYLADRIHHAKASLHDNTYARVHGIWKEWEVVIWDYKFDFRIIIGRIYSQHETLAVFTKMRPGLFETIKHITKTEVKFKFIDGEGLQAILVDGSKPQANVLGAYLVGRNRPHLSGIHERIPKLILSNCLRTCIFHVNRKFSDMAKVVPDAPMARIRRCPYLKTEEELDDFVRWCKDSEYKVVRDWIADKDSAPWFFPSINRFLSNMSEEEWLLTPGDTNLNESAHPHTNQHTGTNLTLLEAIQSAYRFDLKSEAQLRTMEENCVLVNHLNTKPHRDRKNDSRRTSHYRQALERSEARNGLENIDDDIERSTAPTRELRAKKKELKATSGVKQVKRRGEKEKERLPDENEFAGLSDSEDRLESSQLPPTRPLSPLLHFPSKADVVGSHGIQLDPALEPPFFPHESYDDSELFLLPGDITDYLPF
ncbi:hypothetical protein C8R44DRAFT_900928 [Mycena epipterygia]|nr:hypothetical protein C8R44DRAFT_900928 [Mycena epipterygia]